MIAGRTNTSGPIPMTMRIALLTGGLLMKVSQQRHRLLAIDARQIEPPQPIDERVVR